MARGWCHRVTVQACAAAGFQPVFRIEAHDYPTALALVARGLGITVLPSIAARNLPAGVAAAPVTNPTPVRSIHLLTNAPTRDSGVVRRASALIRAEAART